MFYVKGANTIALIPTPQSSRLFMLMFHAKHGPPKKRSFIDSLKIKPQNKSMTKQTSPVSSFCYFSEENDIISPSRQLSKLFHDKK
jgi:hypothetical protein